MRGCLLSECPLSTGTNHHLSPQGSIFRENHVQTLFLILQKLIFAPGSEISESFNIHSEHTWYMNFVIWSSTIYVTKPEDRNAKMTIKSGAIRNICAFTDANVLSLLTLPYGENDSFIESEKEHYVNQRNKY